MRYKLKDYVTDEMLENKGYRLTLDKDIRAIKTLQNRSVFIEHNSSVMAWYKKDIQHLIDLGYVEEMK